MNIIEILKALRVFAVFQLRAKHLLKTYNKDFLSENYILILPDTIIKLEVIDFLITIQASRAISLFVNKRAQMRR